jgi:hypothetical protein
VSRAGKKMAESEKALEGLDLPKPFEVLEER